MKTTFSAMLASLLLAGPAMAQTTWTITIPPITVQQNGPTTATTTPTPPTPPTPTPVATPPAPTPTPAPVQVAAGQTALTVGPGQPITDPASAIGLMASGGVMTVLPGTYKTTFTTGGTVDNLTIKCAVAMKCVMDGQGGYGQGHRMTWGKACIHSYNNTLTISGFHFINCGSPSSGNDYSNEAAVYLDLDDGKNHVLTVTQSGFDNNANGIFAAGGSGSVVVDQDVFGFSAPNGMNGVVIGTANGPAHDMYLAAASVEVRGSYFYGSAAHNVKTRAQKTNVHDNPLMTMDGGRVTDLSNGGALTFTNNSVWSRDDATFPPRTIQSGLRSGVFGNSNMIGVGTENLNAGTPSGTLTGNTFNLARTGSNLWVNAGSLTGSGNKVNLFGQGSLQITGPGSFTGDLSAASAMPNAQAHAPAPPNPPAWYAP